jgi:hypothetical protein
MSTVIDGSASVTINNGAVLGITRGTAVASTSGTSINFTSIPSWAKRITLMLNGVSTNGGNGFSVQIGDTGGFSASGYLGSFGLVANGNVTSAAAISSGFETYSITAANLYYGTAVLFSMGSNVWVCNVQIAGNDNRTFTTSGTKTLTSTLDRVRLTTIGTTNIFDAGSINILYEG